MERLKPNNEQKIAPGDDEMRVVTELGLGSPVLERLAANDSDGIPGFSAHSHRFSNYYHYRRLSTLSLLTIHVEGVVHGHSHWTGLVT